MMKILVTGGAGMIGSNLTMKLISLGYEVKVVDNLWRGKIEYLNDVFGNPVIDIDKHFFNRDLSESGSCDDLLDDVEYVVHLADIVAGISYVFNNQGNIFRQNILINSNVLNSVRKSKIKGLVYIGTACSFPQSLQSSETPILLNESDLYPAHPESAYGWSKLMGQYETELLGQETAIKTCTLMLHNVYGTPCDFGVEKSQVIPSLIRKAIRYPEETFNVWGSGRQGRAFIHVDDVVDGIILALNKGWRHGHIQLGPTKCTSIKQIAELIASISKKEILIEYDLTKPEGDKSRSADNSKARKILGWQPRISLETGLKQQYQWIENQINQGKLG